MTRKNIETYHQNLPHISVLFTNSQPRAIFLATPWDSFVFLCAYDVNWNMTRWPKTFKWSFDLCQTFTSNVRILFNWELYHLRYACISWVVVRYILLLITFSSLECFLNWQNNIRALSIYFNFAWNLHLFLVIVCECEYILVKLCLPHAAGNSYNEILSFRYIFDSAILFFSSRNYVIIPTTILILSRNERVWASWNYRFGQHVKSFAYLHF